MKALFLSAAMLLPTMALAAPASVTISQNKSVTVFHGTPNTKSLPQWHPNSSKIKIFNTFGKKHAYDSSSGWTVANAGSEAGSQQWFAYAITPTAKVTLTEIVEAVSSVAGTSSVTIALLADANGLPGAVLQEKTVTSLETFGDCCAVAVDHVKGGIKLKAGKTYWIGALLPSKKQATTWDAWNFSTSNTNSGPAAFYNSTDGWTATSAEYAAFAVYGE